MIAIGSHRSSNPERLREAERALKTIRPAMQADGGDVQIVAVPSEDDGLVEIRFCGTCIGCPSKSLTLKMGIEPALKNALPWVKGVVAVA